MKKYILVAIIALICFGCKKDFCFILDNDVLVKKNYTEQLLTLDIDSTAFAKEEFFQASFADTIKMQRLDEQTMLQVLDIISDVWKYHYKNKTNSVSNEGSMEVILPTILDETDYLKIFIGERIDVHPDLTSMVIMRASSVHYPHAEQELYLINLKDKELRSIVCLSVVFDPKENTSIEGTTYKNGQFTYTDDIILDPSRERKYFLRKLFSKSLVYFARYEIDENGFIQMIDNKPNESSISLN